MVAILLIVNLCHAFGSLIYRYIYLHVYLYMLELEAFTCEYEDPLLQHEDYWGGYDNIQFHEDASMFHDVLLSDNEE